MAALGQLLLQGGDAEGASPVCCTFTAACGHVGMYLQTRNDHHWSSTARTHSCCGESLGFGRSSLSTRCASSWLSKQCRYCSVLQLALSIILPPICQDVNGGVAAVKEWLQQGTTNCAAPWTTAELLRLLRDVQTHQPDPLLGYYSTPAMATWGEVEQVAAVAGVLPPVRAINHHLGGYVDKTILQGAMGNVHHWAIVFSLVRMLFVAGHLPAVQQLVELGAAVPMPLKKPGPYRNEAAYFGCIRKARGARFVRLWAMSTHCEQQIMERAAPSKRQKALPHLYLLGDSHILPGGTGL